MEIRFHRKLSLFALVLGVSALYVWPRAEAESAQTLSQQAYAITDSMTKFGKPVRCCCLCSPLV